MRASLVILFLVLLPFALASPTNATSTESQNSPVLFFEDFNGSSVDATKWIIMENVNGSGFPAYGGQITVSNNTVHLQDPMGTSFPCIYTRTNPFPQTEDFALEFDITYTELTGRGSGIWVSSMPFGQLTSNPYGNIFQVWAGILEGWGTPVKVYLMGNIIYQSEANWNHPEVSTFKAGIWNTNTFSFRLTESKGEYIAYMNGTQIGQARSDLRPAYLALGEPICTWVPEAVVHGPWTSFKVDSIKILPGTKLTLQSTPSSNEVGYQVDLTGNVTDSNNQAVSNVTVVLSYQIPGVADWNPITSATTGTKGEFAVTWQPSATGNFLVRAEWNGDTEHAGTFENSNLSITRGTGETLFCVESNSTLTSLAFNSTSKEIAFTVTGPDGTAGYVRFLISKTVWPNLTDIQVTLDGKETAFTTHTNNDLQEIDFEYNHSSHSIVVRLPTTQVPELQPLVLLLLIVVVTTLVSVTVSKRKREICGSLSSIA